MNATLNKKKQSTKTKVSKTAKVVQPTKAVRKSKRGGRSPLYLEVLLPPSIDFDSQKIIALQEERISFLEQARHLKLAKLGCPSFITQQLTKLAEDMGEACPHLKYISLLGEIIPLTRRDHLLVTLAKALLRPDPVVYRDELLQWTASPKTLSLYFCTMRKLMEKVDSPWEIKCAFNERVGGWILWKK